MQVCLEHNVYMSVVVEEQKVVETLLSQLIGNEYQVDLTRLGGRVAN